ncbi:MAG TPA: winged helix-turn-helix domain-containing protein [Candidatus Acidoferrum sp.]|nr:winged helix-turn-helix domain-containing protein [Candidatus Acidoferrum sp.]
MESGLESRQVLRFGLYQVDLLQGVLSRQGVRVKIQEQPFRILALLLHKPGEIVTREELRQALWPEGTHVNFDGSLNAALKKLRAALQDDADNPAFVETVPRQGYRFLTPVHSVSGATAVISVPSSASTETAEESFEVRMRLHPEFSPQRAAELYRERKKAERAERWIDFALLSSAIVFGSWLLFFIVYPVPRPSVTRMTRITNASGIDEWGGIVSDGTRIFFLERDGGRWNLMQTSVEGGNAEKMPAPFENTRLFAISPDHSQFLIGQFTRRDDEMPLWLWPVQGGQPRRMGEALGHDPAWSPDGSQVVFVRGRSVFTVHPDGTQLQELAHGPGLPHLPAWSPDGETIRFTMDREDHTQEVWEMAVDGSGLHPVLPSGRQPASQSAGQWTADGRYFLFSGCDNRDCNLWGIREAWNWFRRSHHDPVQLTRGPDSLHVSIPTPAGSRVFAFSFRSDRELQRIEPQSRHAESVVLHANAEVASVSPDGRLALYTDRPDGSLWRSSIDGTHLLRLTQPPLVASAPHWSRDGRQILFTGERPGYLHQIYFLSSDGGALRAVLPEGREASDADWSPDGTQIVVSMREQKTQPKFGIYLFKPSTSEWTLLPESRGLVAPRWSPDGRYVAALDETNHRLLLYDFQTEKWKFLAEGGLLGAPYWTADSSSIYFQDQLDNEQAIFRIRIAGPQVERVVGCGEILRSSSSHCIFSGLGSAGSLYVMVERGLTDIYGMDLDLP